MTGNDKSVLTNISSKALKTFAVETLTLGLTNTAFNCPKPGMRDKFSPMPLICAVFENKQTGTSAPRDMATSTFSILRIRNTAAAFALPPPIPAAIGKFFTNLTCFGLLPVTLNA